MSAIPNASRIQFILTNLSTPSFFCGFSKREIAFFLAIALSFGATPSSNSTQTISAPDARAFRNISGLIPGVKIKLLRARTL